MSVLLSPSSTSSIFITPRSPLYTSIITPVVITNPIYYKDIDTGMNNSWVAQKQMTTHILHRILDKWLYNDRMKSVLKFMKIVDEKVQLVKSESEYQNNELSNNSKLDLEKNLNILKKIC